MLVSQRKGLEEELLLLEEEILNAVWNILEAVTVNLMTSVGKEASPKNPRVRRPGIGGPDLDHPHRRRYDRTGNNAEIGR